MEFKWAIKHIWEVKTVWEKNYQVREFVVEETVWDYPQSAKFQLFWENKVWYLNNLNVWDEVVVAYNLKSRQWKEKWQYFNSIDAWKVNKLSSWSTVKSNSSDDLPF